MCRDGLVQHVNPGLTGVMFCCLSCFSKQDIYWIGFISGFGFYRRQIRCRSYARTTNIKTSKKSCLTSCQHHELHCLVDVIFYRRLTVFQCYLSTIILYNWFPALQMCILRAFGYHWSQSVIWDLRRGILKKTR